jgi:site-specific recombinase XerD
MQALSVHTISPAESVLAMPCQADNDEHLFSLWLHGRGQHTRRAYAAELRRFREFIGTPLPSVRLDDLQRFIDSLEGLADASRARATATIKSLFGFAHRIGYLRFDVGAAIATPKTRNRLSARILTEGQVIAMITLEPNDRNRALLRTLYIGGLRVSELVALCWRDLIARGESEGQASIFGKGSKTRVVLLPASLWQELKSLKGEANEEDDPVFRSRKGGHLDQSRVTKIVRQAARSAGISQNVSPHWLRHAHASHALDRGCPAHLLQQTLGHSSLATTSIYAHARPSDSSSRYLAS